MVDDIVAGVDSVGTEDVTAVNIGYCEAAAADSAGFDFGIVGFDFVDFADVVEEGSSAVGAGQPRRQQQQPKRICFAGCCCSLHACSAGFDWCTYETCSCSC